MNDNNTNMNDNNNNMSNTNNNTFYKKLKLENDLIFKKESQKYNLKQKNEKNGKIISIKYII